MKFRLNIGITARLLAGYSLVVLICCGTVVVLLREVQQIVVISDSIVEQKYQIASISKQMLENLLSMEENEKKYQLLNDEEYLNYFITASNQFNNSFLEMMALDRESAPIPKAWRQLYADYQKHRPETTDLAQLRQASSLWIPEVVINRWIGRLQRARAANGESVIQANMELNRHGQAAVQKALLGLGISLLVGVSCSIFLGYSMIRPMGELTRGIRSISKGRLNDRIKVRTQDELGQLAHAFNELAKRLKEEEMMRSDFIAMLSHEIRTPLTSIRESVNMIAEEVMGPTNAQQRRFLTIASSEIGRIAELLNHLMQVSRLQSADIKLQPRPICPVKTIHTCIQLMQPMAERGHIELENRLPPKLPKIMGDEKYFQQVVMNLLGNAIKFSPPRKQVRVSAQNEPGHQWIKFAVQDFGPGIPQAEQSLIFNKYYRAREVRKHMDGTGLGLSFSKFIIEAHDGEIWVDSTLGRGSTFLFTIPQAR